jgi:hypothetical protein
MGDYPLKYFWLCPTWEFFAIRHDMNAPPSETWVEAQSTFLGVLNRLTHNVRVRATFFDDDGNVDPRFGFDMLISGRGSIQYRTDFHPLHFPKPPDGTLSTGQGWFEVAASHRVYLTAWIRGDKKTAFSRAWGFALHLEEYKPRRITQAIALPDQIDRSHSHFFASDREADRLDPRNRPEH